MKPNRTQTTHVDPRRIRLRMRASDSIPSHLPVSTPATKDRRYQHHVYLVLCGKWASMGQLYCPGSDCSRA